VLTHTHVQALLYFALGGDDWKYDLEFLSDDDICQWNVVVLDPHTGVFSSPMGVTCDRLNLFPTSLYMTNNFQVGSLPTEIGTLFTLREIDMERNTLMGSIPSEFCQLDQLHRVMLGKNSLTGTIPSCISNLDALQSLALNDNEFKGTLPSSFATLDLLEILFLDDNLLSGDALPIFNQLTGLEFFMAQNNKFMGILDEQSFKNSAKLAWLDLSGNEFLSTNDVAFPAHLLSLPQLEVIDLSSNFLSGSLPTNVPLNERLKFLGLHNNDIVGSIPASITNLFALHHLDLSKNQLTGTVDVLGSLKWLRALYLGENSKLAAASIPTMFLDFFYLQDLSLRNTNRVGVVPEFLADLRTLKLLDLGTNDMQGEIPSVLGQLSNLEFLMLNGNPRLTGLLPSTFGALQEMRALFIDGTGIAGNVEEVVCALPSFAVMDGREIAYANCINGLFTCKCCTCCDPNLPDCTSVPFQLNLRESWTKDFAKLNFQFTNETSFLERGEINAEAYSKQDDRRSGGNN
jgi:Leucine-rich repeat (LRR) protein